MNIEGAGVAPKVGHPWSASSGAARDCPLGDPPPESPLFLPQEPPSH